jgi:hypothetical protein
MPKWLKCTITKGMFSDEFTVIVRTRNGENVSVFVPKEAAEEREGRVKVRVAECGGRSLAWLPDEHQSVVDVESSDLQPA